jgi:hydroxypyruvate reductase
LFDSVPDAVKAHLRAGRRGERAETLKPGDARLDRVHQVIVGSLRLAAEAVADAAAARGWHMLLLTTTLEGEAREVARVAVAVAKEVVRYDRPVPRPACLVWGGETTVTVRGSGRGGRNQELALAAGLALDGWPVGVLALATDGVDGPTDAAGAWADGRTVARARDLGLDARQHLTANDAYPFFAALDDLLLTGPTGTNVNDLLVVLVG